jgi:hypothetical protein
MILPRPNRQAQLGKVRIMTRSSLGLERNLRLARALASSETYASPEPWPRARPTPRPSPGLEQDLRLARAPASVRTTSFKASHTRWPHCGWDMGHASAHTRQETTSTVLPTLVLVTPYLRHCEYGRTRKGMGDVKSRHCCHNQAPLFLDAGRGKRPRRELPRPKQGSARLLQGKTWRSTV